MKKILAVFLLLFVSVIPFASAHPIIVDSSPQASSNVGAGVTQITIVFSESVDLDFSNIKVFDSSGNQVDNKDTALFQGDDKSLIVTTPPLQDGVYTVTAKVLSAIDGHLVDYAFVFGVGNVTLPPPPQPSIDQSIYFPEAGARFPGLIGQVVVLGAAIASLLVWRGVQKKEWIRENPDFQKSLHSKFSTITGIALFLVFASNILMLAVQTIRLQVSASDVLQTGFGMIWIMRMGITVVLLAVWFLLQNKNSGAPKKQALILGLSLILIGTTTIIGHGAASEQLSAVIIDYIHNLIASVWIGGIIFFGFILLPAFAKLDNTKKELVSLLMIPRFSSMILASLGIVIITGPTLLWLLEDDLSLLANSYYGMLIIAKIAIGSAMVALGGYKQFRIQKPAEKSISSGPDVYQKLKRSLRTEAALGIALLAVVALLTNSSLPTSQADATASKIPDGFQTYVFSQNIKFPVDITPLKSGANTISISAFDSNGNPIDDITGLTAKVSNPQKNIAPIEVPLTKVEGQNKYEGKMTFGFSGSWNIDINAQRKNNPNESTSLSVVVKPRLSELRGDITEYNLPDKAAPLYPAYDGDDTVWISDASQPRLWKFSISQKQYTSYKFDGKTSVFLKLDGDRLWFTDTPNSTIGSFDTKTEQFNIIPLPIKSIPISLETDFDGNLWIALADKDVLLKYDPSSEQFEEHKIPTPGPGTVALVRDQSGKIWFAESQTGKIGVIDPKNGDIREFMPTEPLKEPFYLYIEPDGNILISEHTALKVTRFDPLLGTFSTLTNLKDPNALAFALAPDKFGNIWIAQHTVDKLGIYDPQKKEFAELPIPTQTTFTQFLFSDKNGDIWFVEQRGNKLGHVEISEIPQASATPQQPEFALRYSEIASPFISAGIIATSLFFVKSIRDKRRIESQID